MKVPYIDLKIQYQSLKKNINQRINDVLEHGQFILGPEIQELENKLSDYVKASAITCASGTSGLMLALKVLNIGYEDEVITTPFSFFATVDSIINVGAKPKFAHIDKTTFNIDVSSIEKLINKKTKAIMPVSLYGQPCDMDEINLIAEKYNLSVIEDAAQSFGAEYKNRKSCNLSTIGVTSFFPAKPLGCYGDGGALFTNNKKLEEEIRTLRIHGQDKRYHHIRIGTNARMDTIQAAILLCKLERYDWELKKRQEIAKIYNQNLKNNPKIKIPHVKSDRISSWAQYTVLIKKRELFQKKLLEMGIPTSIHYPIPMHKQPALEFLKISKNQTPIAEKIAQEVISLPLYPDMPEENLNYIIDSINKVSKDL